MADPVGSYDAKISLKKAGTQTTWSVLSGLVVVLGMVFADATVQTAVLDALRDRPDLLPKMLLAFTVVRIGVGYWRDYQKHKEPAYHMEHGVSPGKAEQLAVASGADPAEARKEAKVAEIEQEK